MFSLPKIIHNPPTGISPDVHSALHSESVDKVLKTRGFSGFSTHPPALLHLQSSFLI